MRKACQSGKGWHAFSFPILEWLGVSVHDFGEESELAAMGSFSGSKGGSVFPEDCADG